MVTCSPVWMFCLYWNRVRRLLDEFCESADKAYFHGCLWECVLSSPSVRLPAINYVLSRYNRKQTMEDQLYLMGTNIDLMVSIEASGWSKSLRSSINNGTVLLNLRCFLFSQANTENGISDGPWPVFKKILSLALNTTVYMLYFHCTLLHLPCIL